MWSDIKELMAYTSYRNNGAEKDFPLSKLAIIVVILIINSDSQLNNSQNISYSYMYKTTHFQ